MSFCFCFKRNRRYMDEIDQLIIKYHPSENLKSFLKEHEKQRVIIDIENADFFLERNGLFVFQTLKNDETATNNWVLRFPSVFDEKTISINDIAKFKEANIPFFFNTYVDRWDIFYGMIDLGVTDIYVVNELGFSLDKCAAAAHKQNIKIRVFPNVAQSSWYNTSDLTKFFIRPEDVEDYLPYVDVFEIFENEENPLFAETLYKVYAKDHRWMGELNEIILNFNVKLNGKYTHPLWTSRRISCDKKCLKGSRCDMCNTIAELGETLEKIQITVGKQDPIKNKPTEEEMQKLIDKYYNNVDKDIFLTDNDKIQKTISVAKKQILEAIKE